MRIQARLEGVGLSLVRYKTNGYSLPMVFGHQSSLVKGYIERVGIIGYGAEVIARHNRSYEKTDFIYDSLHYLALLERKP